LQVIAAQQELRFEVNGNSALVIQVSLRITLHQAATLSNSLHTVLQQYPYHSFLHCTPFKCDLHMCVTLKF